MVIGRGIGHIYRNWTECITYYMPSKLIHAIHRNQWTQGLHMYDPCVCVYKAAVISDLIKCPVWIMGTRRAVL